MLVRCCAAALLSYSLALQVTGCSKALVDESVLTFCLFEGISNARKYCEPGTALSIRASLKDPQETSASEEVVARVPARCLHIELDNVHPTAVAPLSAEQCLRVFDAGYKGHNSKPTTGLGMRSIGFFSHMLISRPGK